MKASKVAAVIAPKPIKLERFTIDRLSKMMNNPNNRKNLHELLSVYPNYGEGFKIIENKSKYEYYIIQKALFQVNS